MVSMPSIVRHLSEALSGLALTWLVVHIPGEYAYASVWLMPTLAACFAFATWFAFMYRRMDQELPWVWNQPVDDQKRSDHLGMDDVFEAWGKVCVGAGVLSMLIQAISSPTHCSWEFPFAMGVGFLVGVKVLRKISARSVETGSKPFSRPTIS